MKLTIKITLLWVKCVYADVYNNYSIFHHRSPHGPVFSGRRCLLSGPELPVVLWCVSLSSAQGGSGDVAGGAAEQSHILRGRLASTARLPVDIWKSLCNDNTLLMMCLCPISLITAATIKICPCTLVSFSSLTVSLFHSGTQTQTCPGFPAHPAVPEKPWRGGRLFQPTEKCQTKSAGQVQKSW